MAAEPPDDDLQDFIRRADMVQKQVEALAKGDLAPGDAHVDVGEHLPATVVAEGQAIDLDDVVGAHWLGIRLYFQRRIVLEKARRWAAGKFPHRLRSGWVPITTPAGSHISCQGCAKNSRWVISGRREVQSQLEGSALAGLGIHPDIAVHGLDEMAADREPKPRAAILAGRGHIGLRKALEQCVELVRGDADTGVPHRDESLYPALDQRCPARECNLAMGGELDRV